jgi:hypothetical protein
MSTVAVSHHEWLPASTASSPSPAAADDEPPATDRGTCWSPPTSDIADRGASIQAPPSSQVTSRTTDTMFHLMTTRLPTSSHHRSTTCVSAGHVGAAGIEPATARV